MKELMTEILISDVKTIRTYKLTSLLPDVLLNFDKIQK